jgi:C4-dicarboxylate transporter, DctQ subunit
MTKLLDRLNDFLAVVVSVILVLMTLTIGYAIFARAVGLPGPVWIVQFNEYGMLWATFLGSAWLLSKKRHVSIELVVSHLSRGTQKVFHLIHSLLGVGLCAVLCWFGTATTLEQLQRNVIHVQAVDVPMGYILLAIPFGFFLLFLQFIRDVFAAVHALRNPLVPDPLDVGAPGEEHAGGGH